MHASSKALRPIAFVLVPASSYRETFTSAIEALATELGAPPFEPHITLYVGIQTPEDKVETLLAGIAVDTGAIALIAGNTGHSPALFKTLYIEFELDRPLADLHRRLREGSKQPVDYELRPHLSLLYKELPEAKREELAARYVFRGQRILFDQIAAVRPAGDDSHWLDIQGWNVWLRHTLRSPGGVCWENSRS